MKRFVIASVFFLAATAYSSAQSALKFGDNVHDFGQILISEGPVSCTFSAVNVSDRPAVIQSVATSCGCTAVKWEREAVKPGQTTSVSVTYSNDEGPYPFDKTLTVKVTGESRPVILHIRGTSVERLRPDSEMFPAVHCSAFALPSDSFKGGNVEQGMSKEDRTTVANLSGSPVRISFADVSDGLSLEVRPNPVPAGGHSTLYYTVTARRDKWGSNVYGAKPVVDGKVSDRTISVTAFTVENFSGLTKEEKAGGSRPVFAESTFSFNHVRQGTKVNATFTCVNKGASELVVHKVDIDTPGAFASAFPTVAPSAEGSFSVSLDTGELPKGEALVIVTLTTNSPSRPIVNLFLAGIID